MSKFILQITAAFLLISALTAQTDSQSVACRQNAFTALRPIPELKYKCRRDSDDYGSEILKYPERTGAINRYIKSLEKFTYNDWWKISVDDLNVCDFRKKTGILGDDEKKQYEESYFPLLRGNNQFRMISVADPCYQTGFNGASVFLLYRKNKNVYATEIIDGYFSRADYGPEIDFAVHNKERIIEVSTTSGGLNPTITNYYFTIDKKTNKAIPKNLFAGDNKKLTNQITSMMLLGESGEYGLPPNLEPLVVFKKGRLAKSFDIFTDTAETFGEDNHQKFTRLTLRWNGKFYE